MFFSQNGDAQKSFTAPLNIFFRASPVLRYSVKNKFNNLIEYQRIATA